MNKLVRAKLLVVMSVLAIASLAFPAMAQAQAPDSFVVQIYRVTSHVGDACGGPEFYALIGSDVTLHRTSTVNGVYYGNGEWRLEQPDPLPAGVSHGDNWQTSGLIKEGQTFQVDMRLKEQDSPGCGGGDDHIDIVPGTAKDLQLWVTRTPDYEWVYWDKQSQICQRGPNFSRCEFVTHGTGIDLQKSFVPSSHWKMWYKTFLGNYSDSAWVRLVVYFIR